MHALEGGRRGERVVELSDHVVVSEIRPGPGRRRDPGAFRVIAFRPRGRRCPGRTRAEIGLPATVDDSFILTDGDTIESVLAQYRQAWTNADEIASAYSLDDLAMHNRRGPLPLRWIYLHMIEELARHAGHGDILREQILAAGGSPA